MFNIGDRVKYIRSGGLLFKQNQIYIVKDSIPYGPQLIGFDGYWYHGNFELVTCFE
jgi:hypothetical protein